jgi:hypothetical protein
VVPQNASSSSPPPNEPVKKTAYTELSFDKKGSKPKKPEKKKAEAATSYVDLDFDKMDELREDKMLE